MVANLISDNAVLGVTAVGMTFVILSGGIDLSVGSVVAFTTVLIATLVGRHGLHAERHLERVDPGGDFGVAGDVEPHLIQLLQRVQGIALQFTIDAARIG